MGAGASVPEEHQAKFDEMVGDLSPVDKERAEQHLAQLQGAGVSDPELLTNLMQSYADALKGGKSIERSEPAPTKCTRNAYQYLDCIRTARSAHVACPALAHHRRRRHAPTVPTHLSADVLVAERGAMIKQATGALTNQAHHQFLVSVDGSEYSHRAFEVRD